MARDGLQEALGGEHLLELSAALQGIRVVTAADELAYRI